jgi:phosphoglycolate phosphatase
MTDQLPILLFDLDGTLVDTAPDLVTTLNVILAKHGRAPMALKFVKKMIGNGARALLERGFDATGAPATDLETLMADFMDIYISASTVYSRPYDGAVEALEGFNAAGYRMAVCTNKPQAPSETILHELDLMRFFDAVAGGDRFPVRKPDAQHLLGALELMDAANHPAIMVGDSYNDVAAARNAGMPVIVVSYGYTTIPPSELDGDILVDHFAEIPAAVKSLCS